VTQQPKKTCQTTCRGPYLIQKEKLLISKNLVIRKRNLFDSKRKAFDLQETCQKKKSF
jgi:hypothetical protein